MNSFELVLCMQYTDLSANANNKDQDQRAVTGSPLVRLCTVCNRHNFCLTKYKLQIYGIYIYFFTLYSHVYENPTQSFNVYL